MNYTPKDGFPYYFNLTGNIDLKSLFDSSKTIEFLNSIEEEKAKYRYASGKWSIKQVVGHITDHERIKMQRAFLTSRSIPTQLWGYNQEMLVNNSRFDELTFQHLINDYQNVRKASISFIDGLSERQLNIKGMANEHEIILKDFLISIVGHEMHHINILKEKYL
ncbi:MAG: DinB family protein [Allomuricauda sp.]